MKELEKMGSFKHLFARKGMVINMKKFVIPTVITAVLGSVAAVLAIVFHKKKKEYL